MRFATGLPGVSRAERPRNAESMIDAVGRLAELPAFR